MIGAWLMIGGGLCILLSLPAHIMGRVAAALVRRVAGRPSK
jgi:hypothetical protein